MISNVISRCSALVLAVSGFALLFSSDVLLPRIITGFPVTGTWLGQLLGAALLGFATLDWLSRAAILGGIYGRAVVSANTALYFVGAVSILKAAVRSADATPLLVIGIPAALLAIAYAALLFRGPFDARVTGPRVQE